MTIVAFQKGSATPKNGIYLFSAPWCAPCKALHPIIEESSRTVIEINVDAFSELATYFNVSGVPCLIVLEDGKEVRRLRGSQSNRDSVRKFLEREL